MQQIVDGIKHGQVSSIDRLLLLDNYTMLQRGGFSSTTELLELLKGYGHETTDNVWGAMAVAIGEARKLAEADDKANEQLDKLVQKLVTTTALRLGWDDKPGDDAQTLRLRGLSVSLAAGAQTPAILEEGARRFKAFRNRVIWPPVPVLPFTAISVPATAARPISKNCSPSTTRLPTPTTATRSPAL